MKRIAEAVTITRHRIPFIGFFLSALFLAAPSLFLYYGHLGMDVHLKLINLTCIFALAWAVFILLIRMSSFTRFADSPARLLFIFIEFFLLFAGIYNCLGFFGDISGIPFFSGLPDFPHLSGKTAEDVSALRRYSLKLVSASFHFSITTASTTGFGDIIPTHWLSRLVVDVQMFASWVIVVLGFGHYLKSNAGM